MTCCVLQIDAALFLLLPIFESFPITLVISGLVAQLCHYMLMRTFPAIQIKSPWFAATISKSSLANLLPQGLTICRSCQSLSVFSSFLVLFLVNHYLAFRHFTEHYYAFNEAFAFFFLFMWLVPMALLVSLSANDMVLPTYSDSASSLGRSMISFSVLCLSGSTSGWRSDAVTLASPFRQREFFYE